MESSCETLSVQELLIKYFSDEPHSIQVKKIAEIIFDKTKDVLHNFGSKEREILGVAAFLHDIGYFVESRKHNKHSYKLIKKHQLKGFDSKENEIIANIARYHRGKTPKQSHKCFSRLQDAETKMLVKKLSAILRIADGLDHSHRQLISDIDCRFNDSTKTLIVALNADNKKCKDEIKTAKRKKTAFEEEFSVHVKFQVSKDTH